MPNFAINGNSPFSCDTTNGFKKSNTNVTTTIMQNMTGLTLTAGNLKNPMYKINSDISWANTGKHQEAMYFIINNYNTNLMQQYIKDIARFQSNFRGTVSGVASPSINYELGGVLDTIANIGNHTQYNLNINYSDPSISNCFTIRNIPTCDLTGNSANPLFNVWDNSRSSNLWEYMDFELLYNSVNTVMPGVISDVYSLFKENPAFFFDKDKARVIFIDSTNPSPVSSQMFSFTDGSGNSFGDISTIS
jgi:hypothetical protein